MLRAGILVLVTGCRGLLGIEEAQIFDASVTPNVDANIDALIDSAAITCSPTAFIASTSLGTDGSWFTADRTSGRATKLDVAATIRGSEGNTYNLPATGYTTIISSAIVSYDAPRLSPGGNELYAVEDSSGFYSLIRTTWVAPLMWSSPQPVELASGAGFVLLAAGDAPSSVTTTNPRRMIISRTGGYDEYVEVTPTRWSRVSSVGASAFSVAFLGEGMLSPDGLRLAFRGQVGAANIGAYMVTRPDVATPFSPAALRLPTEPVNVSRPFLTDDCKHLYFTDGNTGILQHVRYP